MATEQESLHGTAHQKFAQLLNFREELLCRDVLKALKHERRFRASAMDADLRIMQRRSQRLNDRSAQVTSALTGAELQTFSELDKRGKLEPLRLTSAPNYNARIASRQKRTASAVRQVASPATFSGTQCDLCVNVKRQVRPASSAARLDINELEVAKKQAAFASNSGVNGKPRHVSSASEARNAAFWFGRTDDCFRCAHRSRANSTVSWQSGSSDTAQTPRLQSDCSSELPVFSKDSQFMVIPQQSLVKIENERMSVILTKIATFLKQYCEKPKYSKQARELQDKIRDEDMMIII